MNGLLPLSFVNVQLDSINGKNLNDFYVNIVYKDVPVSISTRLEFNEPLTVDNLQLHSDFSGFNLNELITQVQLYQLVTNYNEHLEHMSVIGHAIVDELKSKSFGFLVRSFNEHFPIRLSDSKKILHGHVPSAASHIWEYKENHQR